MNRARNPYWQRLRRDKRSGFATFVTVLAWLPAVIATVLLATEAGTQAEARGNPLYWLILLPFAWWGASLTRYEPWAVRLIRPAQVLAPALAISATAIAAAIAEAVMPFVIAAALSFVAAVAGWWLYTGSMLQVEGPVP